MNKYIHKNWPLYELLNQISKIIREVLQSKSSQKIKLSSLSLHQKEDLIAHTEEICNYILEAYILDKDSSSKWIPKLNVRKETKLAYILATSDLVSYMFEYKLMPTKKKNEYLKKVENTVSTIYNKLMNNNTLYNAISFSINENENENEEIIKYKNHLVHPRFVFLFTITIIQEVIRRSLTKSYDNIFYTINKSFRDGGRIEKAMIDKITKDAKTYTLFYHYFEKPVPETIKNKEKKLNNWLKELNKLRFGVLDDYLLDLAQFSHVSFEEIVFLI